MTDNATDPTADTADDNEVFNIDADIENADWLRSLYWDLPLEPEKVFVIICGTYGTVDDQKANWEHFLTLPAAKPMPPEVKFGVEKYLASGGAEALPAPTPPPAPVAPLTAASPKAPVREPKADWRTFSKTRAQKN